MLKFLIIISRLVIIIIIFFCLSFMINAISSLLIPLISSFSN